MGYGAISLTRTGAFILRTKPVPVLALRVSIAYRMEGIVRFLLAWTLYGIGHLVSRWNDHDARFTEVGFRLYQWLMLTSERVQGLGRGPWLDPVTHKGTSI